MVREEEMLRKDLRLTIYHQWQIITKQSPQQVDLALLVLTCLPPFQSLSQGTQAITGDSEEDLLLEEFKILPLHDLHQLAS